MAAEKPWYKLTISLDAAKVETLMKALTHLNELTTAQSQPGDLKTRIAMESFHEETLLAIRDDFEAWLRVNRVGIDGKVTLEAPVVRPRPEAEPTPMEEYLDRLRPTPGSGVDAVEISAGRRSVRLEARESRG